MTQTEALKLVDALNELLESFEKDGKFCKSSSIRNELYDCLKQTLEESKEALAQSEQDTCKGCNGNGVVGNILDTDTCPCCKGSGIEAQPEQEIVAQCTESDSLNCKYCRKTESCKALQAPPYTTPPQRKPLAYIDLRRVANQCGLGVNEVSAQAQAKVDNFARAIEAAHGIKE